MSAILIRINPIPAPVYFKQFPAATSLSELAVTDSGLGEWTGFYDWLRTDVGMLIGVRYWPFEQAEFLLRAVPEEGAIRLDQRGALLIFFSDQRRFAEHLSDDQAFEESRIFSSAGEYSILFGCSAVSSEENGMLNALAQTTRHAREGSG